jgi:sugar/nucleoside kinase (ribokinase family)
MEPVWALILGDLVVDVFASLSDHRAAARLASGADLDLEGVVNLMPGGSAWLFADALSRASTILPVVCGALGNDWAGTYLAQEMTNRSFPTYALHHAVGVVTSNVVMCSFADRHRLMIASKDPRLDYTPVFRSGLRMLSQLQTDPAFAWISGYVLTKGTNEVVDRLESLARLCGELRERRSPIVLDLVPHKFLDKVGTIQEIESTIGPIDVIVGELGTVVDLGFHAEGSTGSRLDALVSCAALLSRGRQGAIVQQRTATRIYSQAVAGGALPHPVIMQQPIAEPGLRGIGDLLAVKGLTNQLNVSASRS